MSFRTQELSEETGRKRIFIVQQIDRLTIYSGRVEASSPKQPREQMRLHLLHHLGLARIFGRIPHFGYAHLHPS